MNNFIRAQIFNITTIAKSFKEGCHLAVLENDGKISEAERKTLKKIDSAVDRFIKELNRIK